MRLTTRTNLALRVLMTCGINSGAKLRTADIAERCNASVHHLLQVVHTLQEHGFVDTLRGRGGGLRLARDSGEISIGEVFRIFESGTPFAECFSEEGNTCPLVSACRLRNYLTRALDAFYHELDMITLRDLVRGNCGLHELLDMAPQAPANCETAS
ncbi:HTH-type transcriptional repressor NsrR [Roseibaca ekhonensis]|uniref:HTH-type transcriptional repressor NsrR n=1 Tax=Roseinatronobacter ekhonensis TaxID=254356 RepID=A0A3B0M403_9RHOB|nr:Rrf2 family transcriptional regulator [Roseibaca ekhonensis]SUZ30290.1 HTH-type transcriptional repressor NsrR [Roseibaca ekhonensis]